MNSFCGEWYIRFYSANFTKNHYHSGVFWVPRINTRAQNFRIFSISGVGGGWVIHCCTFILKSSLKAHSSLRLSFFYYIFALTIFQSRTSESNKKEKERKELSSRLILTIEWKFHLLLYKLENTRDNVYDTLIWVRWSFPRRVLKLTPSVI